VRRVPVRVRARCIACRSWAVGSLSVGERIFRVLVSPPPSVVCLRIVVVSDWPASARGSIESADESVVVCGKCVCRVIGVS